jgi:hypothetical protein
MRKVVDELAVSPLCAHASLPGLVVGRIVEISPEGRLVVDYPGNEFGPMQARCVRRELCCREYETGSSVLLAFEKEDPLKPIVMGSVFESCGVVGAPLAVTLNENCIVLRADRDILLECGQSSLLMRKDGKIVIRAAEIVSRASRTNKVRGACVKIN